MLPERRRRRSSPAHGRKAREAGRIGHVLLSRGRSRCAPEKFLHRGSRVRWCMEQDPEHGGLFMALAGHAHTLDLFPAARPNALAARAGLAGPRPRRVPRIESAEDAARRLLRPFKDKRRQDRAGRCDHISQAVNLLSRIPATQHARDLLRGPNAREAVPARTPRPRAPLVFGALGPREPDAWIGHIVIRRVADGPHAAEAASRRRPKLLHTRCGRGRPVRWAARVVSTHIADSASFGALIASPPGGVQPAALAPRVRRVVGGLPGGFEWELTGERRAAGDEGRDRSGVPCGTVHHIRTSTTTLAAPGRRDGQPARTTFNACEQCGYTDGRPRRVVARGRARASASPFDARSVRAFAADVRRAETLGWDAALQPDSQLPRRDT